MTESFLPYGRQSIDESDVAAVRRALESGWLTTGPEIGAFEAEFAEAVGAGHAVACANGTAALHLALEALGIGLGDVCVVPAITFMATANAGRYCGADVVFADVDADTGLMTADTFAEALDRAGPPAKAVLPVHLAGALCDMELIGALARRAGVRIVEDSCHALGSTRGDGSRAGDAKTGDAATFSFHPVKTLACGEGGMVTTNDAALAERIRMMRAHGIERDPSRFQSLPPAPWVHEMQALGFNYRMPDLNAALGRSQLARLGGFAARRRKLAALYAEALAGLAPVVLSPVAQPGVDPCRHLMNVRIDFEAAGRTRSQAMQALADQGVGSQVHYIPVHRQPYYADRQEPQDLPGAETYYARTLSLPLFADMADTDVDRVVAALKSALGL